MGNSVSSDRDDIKAALLKRALGYEVEEREIILDKNKQDSGRVKVIKKHIPPDPKAIEIVRKLIDTGRW